MKQLLLDLIPPPRPTLSNFVTGRNAEAVAVLQSLAVAPRAAKVVYLWGEPGAGKSHLAAALTASTDWAAFDATGRPDVDGGTVVDDVGTLDEAAQQALFNRINAQLQGAGAVVATGDAAPRDLPMRRDLASRLGSGLVFQLHPLSDAEKSAALAAHAASRGFSLRGDVLNYLLRHARRDMPSLMGFLDALDRHSIETGREITVPMLKDLMHPTLDLPA